MPKKLPKAAEPVLLDLEQFVLHAAVDFEHHWFFAAHETVTRFDDVLSEWDFWWASCSSVTWTATVVSLSKFYETNVHTDSLKGSNLTSISHTDNSPDGSPKQSLEDTGI